MSNLRNSPVALSNLRVKGHTIRLCICVRFSSSLYNYEGGGSKTPIKNSVSILLGCYISHWKISLKLNCKFNGLNVDVLPGEI